MWFAAIFSSFVPFPLLCVTNAHAYIGQTLLKSNLNRTAIMGILKLHMTFYQCTGHAHSALGLPLWAFKLFLFWTLKVFFLGGGSA